MSQALGRGRVANLIQHGTRPQDEIETCQSCQLNEKGEGPKGTRKPTGICFNTAQIEFVDGWDYTLETLAHPAIRRVRRNKD
jgi:hypothetical protein